MSKKRKPSALDHLPAEVLQRLQAYGGRDALIGRMCGNGEEVEAMAMMEENSHRKEREELCAYFLPLVSWLVNAGLLSVSIDLRACVGCNKRAPAELNHVNGNAAFAFVNGIINVHANSVDGGMYKYLTGDDEEERPKPERNGKATKPKPEKVAAK